VEAYALLYSGRPNPHWQVPEHLAELVRHALAAAPPAGAGGAEPPGLGYGGIRIRYREAEVVRTADLFGGVAVIEGRRLADPQRRLERALLASGAEQFPQLRDFL
jgi:hypothetical protein